MPSAKPREALEKARRRIADVVRELRQSRHWSQAQFAKQLDHAMILVTLRTSLRFGELVALRWEDVDLVTGG